MENSRMKRGTPVVYSTRGICRITDIITRTVDRDTKEYYVLTPVFDSRSTYFIPVDYGEKVHIKKALTKAQARDLLAFAETAPPLDWIAAPNERRQQYDRIYKAAPREMKVRLIKALRQHERLQKEHGKQLYAADSRILSGCEALVGDELAFVLGLPREEILSAF